MTSPTFEVSGSVVAFTDSGTATTFSVTPEAVTFDVVNVAGYTVAVTELDQLSDVDTSGVANGDALVYDSGTWVAGTVAGSGGTASVVLAGDVVGTAVAGTVTTDIAPSGVAAGTYGSSGTAVVLTVGADGRITSIAGTAISGGGSLPSQTGHAGEVLATDGSSAGWQDYVEKTATGTTAGVSWGGGAAALTAVNGSDEASAQVTPAGTEMYATDGTDEKYVRVLPDGFHVVGDVGETVLSGDDYLMSTASDTDVQAPGATFARARGSVGSESAVTNGDILAYPLYAQGHDGTSLVLAGQITAEVDGTVATGKVPTRIRIATADADGVLTDRMTIGADGTTDVLGDFTVNGSPVSGGGGGGLVLVDSDSFAAASSLSLPDDSFDSSAHDDYRLIVDWVNAGGSGGYENYLRMRGGGADNTAANYATSGIYHGGATGHKTNTAQTAFTALFDGYGSGDFSRLVLDILRPAEAAYTTISGHRIYTYGGTLYGATLSGLHAVASAFDALTIVSASGTLTGRWALYGYAK